MQSQDTSQESKIISIKTPDTKITSKKKTGKGKDKDKETIRIAPESTLNEMTEQNTRTKKTSGETIEMITFLETDKH